MGTASQQEIEEMQDREPAVTNQALTGRRFLATSAGTGGKPYCHGFRGAYPTSASSLVVSLYPTGSF